MAEHMNQYLIKYPSIKKKTYIHESKLELSMYSSLYSHMKIQVYL